MAPFLRVDKMGNEKGQALVEAIVLAPFFKLLLVGLVGLGYAFISFYYIDFQSYQTALCLEKGKGRHFCESQFRDHVNQVPFLEVHSIHIFYNAFQLRFESELSTPFLDHKLFSYEWSRPLKAEDFGEH